MMLAELKVASCEDLSRVYKITVEKDPDRVYCTCTGCMVHGYCKHIRFYKKAIKKLLEKGNGDN
jgi:hypothetical protein